MTLYCERLGCDAGGVRRGPQTSRPWPLVPFSPWRSGCTTRLASGSPG